MVKTKIKLSVTDNILSIKPNIYVDQEFINHDEDIQILLIKTDQLINETYAVLDQKDRILFVSPAVYELLKDDSLTESLLKQLEINDLYDESEITFFKNLK